MASAPSVQRIWCDEDDHRRYEDFADFNAWFDGESASELRLLSKVDGLAQPSKAYFAGDREGYDTSFQQYQLDRRNEHLGKTFLTELATDDHWFTRNEQHFDQLLRCIVGGDVVPFVGAGLSQPGGFPTWKDHLRQQGRTAGIPPENTEGALAAGQYEEIIAEIENIRGRDVFIQEIRDAFGRNGSIPEAIYLIAELFPDTIITTNYDRLIEQAFDTGESQSVQIVTPATIALTPDATKTTLIKLHGDIGVAAGCILSKSQYDAAYGSGGIDTSLPIPQALDYYYRNSSLLFLGCGLNQDRTIHVFEAIKAQVDAAELPQHFAIEKCPADETQMSDRNAYLLRLGITPIWFEPGCFEFVEGILRLARNELRYQRR